MVGINECGLAVKHQFNSKKLPWGGFPWLPVIRHDPAFFLFDPNLTHSSCLHHLSNQNIGRTLFLSANCSLRACPLPGIYLTYSSIPSPFLGAFCKGYGLLDFYTGLFKYCEVRIMRFLFSLRLCLPLSDKYLSDLAIYTGRSSYRAARQHAFAD